MTSPPSIPVGSGPVPNGTFLHFAISDKVSLQVNVGSGDALVTTSDITIPEIGTSLTLGASYNSLLVNSGVATGEMDAYGWRQSEGADVQLYPATSDGSVTYLGEDGTAGKFTQSTGNTYTSPAVFHASLLSSPTSGSCSGSGYSLTWHQSGLAMCFNSSGILTKEVDRNGNTTAFAYDGLENKVTYTPAGASSPTRTVTANNNGYWLEGFTESGGSAGTKTVTYTPSASPGDLTSVKQADGTTVTFGYDGSHDLTSIKNGAGSTTTLTYNSSHKVTSVTQQTTGTSTATTRLDYVSATETQVADPDTNQSDSVPSVPNVTYTIGSSDALVTKVVNQGGNTTTTAYNGYDEVESYNNGLSSTSTQNTYGDGSSAPKESLIKSVSPTGATTSVSYGNPDTTANPTAEYQPSSSADAQGNTTAYTYNGPGDLATADNSALAATSKVTYNSDGTPATSTDPAGGVTTYSYTDGDHELNKVTPPSGGSLKPYTITYDGFGRVATITNGDGDTVTYTYDLADRITKAAWTGSSTPVTVTYAYDGAGNLKTQADSSGTTTYTYDGRNLVTSKDATSGGGTVTYVYDASGNLTSLTGPTGGGTVSYTYNSQNELTGMHDPTGEYWQFTYNADGQRIITYFGTPSATSTASWHAEITTSHDPGGRISEVKAVENSASPTTVTDTTYCYSKTSPCPASQSTSDTSLVQYSVNKLTSTTSQYTYDKGNRLTQATNVGGSSTYNYGYNTDGDVTSGSTVGALTYNADNQITSSGYSYDAAGNQTANPANGTQAYNDAGQMTSATAYQGPESFTYAGDSQDQLLSDGTASNITYGLDGPGGQPWVQSYTPAMAGGASMYVLRDQQGTPLGTYTGATGGSWAFVTNNTGSVINMINTSGATAATYTYSPYGYMISRSGGMDAENLIDYAGGLTDLHTDIAGIPSTSYEHFGDRWYNPSASSFTTPDPQTVIGDPSNASTYPYAADNPANYTDPTGRCGVVAGGGVGAEIGTVVGGVGGALVGGLVSGGIGAVPGFFLGAGEGATLGTIVGGAICGLTELF